MLVYACEDVFQRLPVHWMWWPAIGAVVVGIGGLIDPRVLGVGYDTIHSLMQGEIVGAALIGLLIAKAVVWSVALGSGTSGGVLAPLLIMGGALGAWLGHWMPVGDPRSLGDGRHGGHDGGHDESAVHRNDLRPGTFARSEHFAGVAGELHRGVWHRRAV